MSSEQILFYSENCYGTPDTIAFDEKKLRVHDLKTGVNDGSFNQLMIYVALFCLEYGIKPGMIETELRIYQNDEVKVLIPELDDIAHIMSKIISFDQMIENIKAGGYSG